MIMKVISALSAFASIFSLAFVNSMPIIIRIVIVIVSVAALGYLCYSIYVDEHKNERVCRSSYEVGDVMKSLIKTQGKVCIMSRDLSWVNPEIEACIAGKKDNILIFAQKESDLTKRLIKNGAVIQYYGDLGFEPATRFTVVRYNRDNPQVAIANTQTSVRKKNKFKHTIYQTGDGNCQQDKWINSLALDMIKLCDIASKGK